MKKIIIVVLVIIGITVFNNKQQEVLIPKEAIRFRIIANSDNKVDQEAKLIVRDKIETQITNDLTKTSNREEARKTLKENINNYENIVSKTLKDNNLETDFSINYGMNYFPEKKYKGVKYESGDYESLVVTLGNGLGKNWWCVLFPPLCLLEGEEEQETEEVEYKFFVQEMIEKFLK